MVTKLVLLIVAVAVAIEPIGAFSPSTGSHLQVRRSAVVKVRRSLPVVHSAKVLPVAYSSASAALLYRATEAVPKINKAVLIATATLALFNLGPTDNARLASAKRACKLYPSCTPPSQHRKNALKWRSLVRVKLVGQLIGLVWMAASKTSVGVMRGAAAVMVTNMIFFLGGAGAVMHDKDGVASPMSATKSLGLLTIDTVLTAAALVAATSPVDSARYAQCAAVFAGGAAIGGLEGLAVLIARLVERK